MKELTVSQFSVVLPILEGIKQKVLPYAICEGYNPGRVFTDQLENPRIALVWSPVGYYFLAGDPSQEQFKQPISKVLTDFFIPASKAYGETGFILITSNQNWKDSVPELLPNREVIEIYRRAYHIDLDQQTKLKNWREQLPQGFEIIMLDKTLAENVGVQSSWVSSTDFLANGFGFALMNGDEMVCSCHSIFRKSNQVEIDVHTAEKYQRKGFARLTVSAFLEECQKRKIQPNWECFWDNEASTGLAEKLGFSAEADYPVYFWEE